MEFKNGKNFPWNTLKNKEPIKSTGKKNNPIERNKGPIPEMVLNGFLMGIIPEIKKIIF